MTTPNDARRSPETDRTTISQVDAVLFDLDQTLVDYDQTGDEILPTVFERVGIEPFCTYADLEAVAADVPFEPDLAHADYWHEVFERAAERHGGDPGHAPALYEAYGNVFDRTQVHLLPGAEAALDAAREFCRVGLVTNGERAIQETKLANLGIADAFETAVYADEVDDPKPAPEPLRVALDDLGVASEDALYVGDSHRYDIAAARSAGLRAAWCPHDGGAAETPVAVDREPDHTFESLHELAMLLGGSTETAPPDRSQRDDREGSQ